MREQFGEKVFKVMLDAGFTCPNRDGTIATGGCTFCSARGSGDFAGSRRDQNIVYQVLKIVTSPVTRVARILSPRFIPDRHVPFVAFGLLLWIWLFAIVMIWNVRRGG